MARNNNNLHSAKSAKNDEFYTQLTDIEKELMHYKEFFNGKIVLCNCNDALHSNFAKYFSLNFEFLGLKKLICTAYKVDGEHGKVCIYEGDKNGNKVPDLDEWETYMLDGDGGFASEECIEFLKECDVVVTNPPFSLFREYVALLMQYNKKFLIIGNMNAITYKEIFPLIKENKMWLGATYFNGGAAYFYGDASLYDESKVVDPKHYYVKDGFLFWRVNGVRWFTNIDHNKRHEEIDLYKHYNAEEYPKYDNYDAIEVSKVCEIPMDYDGVMGVPISFLDKYCPTQFEIVGATESEGKGFSQGLWKEESKVSQPLISGSRVYKRIFIKQVS